jgi:hypothetical protein
LSVERFCSRKSFPALEKTQMVRWLVFGVLLGLGVFASPTPFKYGPELANPRSISSQNGVLANRLVAAPAEAGRERICSTFVTRLDRDQAYDMARVDFETTLGDIEEWTVVNDAGDTNRIGVAPAVRPR